MTNKFNILSLSGGGFLGLYTVSVLEALAHQLSDVPKGLQVERLKALLPIAVKPVVDELPTRVAFRNGLDRADR